MIKTVLKTVVCVVLVRNAALAQEALQCEEPIGMSVNPIGADGKLEVLG